MIISMIPVFAEENAMNNAITPAIAQILNFFMFAPPNHFIQSNNDYSTHFSQNQQLITILLAKKQES